MAGTMWWNLNYRIYKTIQENNYWLYQTKKKFYLCTQLLTGLRLNFSRLNGHTFRHNFKDMIEPMCRCSFEPETTNLYLFRCKLYTNLRLDLSSDICTTLHKNWNFPLRISPVNVTKSAVSCEFGDIYWRNP